MAPKTGRTRQKQRTRDALLDGARRLLARGEPVTVAAAAAEHGISRATAYRYFSDPQALTLEAGLATLLPPYGEVVAGTATLRDRLLAITDAMMKLTLENEPAFRQYLARSVEAPEEARTRGARRIAYMERALSEFPGSLSASDRADLVACLSASTGIEALVAIVDVAKVPRTRARQICRNTTEAVIERYLGPHREAAAMESPGTASIA